MEVQTPEVQNYKNSTFPLVPEVMIVVMKHCAAHYIWPIPAGNNTCHNEDKNPLKELQKDERNSKARNIIVLM